MLAMGAGAAAFSAARRVVLAEGATEMLMLPTLIKKAVDLDDLDYQVAPGLSEVPISMYPELDLEGARVAFLVDGDVSGTKIHDDLVGAGVPEARIVTLGALTLENLLDPDSYKDVVVQLVNEANATANVVIDDLPDFPDPSAETWPSVLESWAKASGYSLPGKRVVASRLVEEGLARPSFEGAEVLRKVHAEIEQVLKGATA